MITKEQYILKHSEIVEALEKADREVAETNSDYLTVVVYIDENGNVDSFHRYPGDDGKRLGADNFVIAKLHQEHIDYEDFITEPDETVEDVIDYFCDDFDAEEWYRVAQGELE